ncbi:MAG: hypothetical protein ABSF14_05070 [Terriglobia bacterium]|jgi:hypothetical protein
MKRRQTKIKSDEDNGRCGTKLPIDFSAARLHLPFPIPKTHRNGSAQLELAHRRRALASGAEALSYSRAFTAGLNRLRKNAGFLLSGSLAS